MATHIERLRAEIAKRSKATSKKPRGPVTVMSAGRTISELREVIPSGSEVLDREVLGCGGWPVGRVVELYALEGAGKSSCALKALAQAQALGGGGVLIDVERSLDQKWAALHGVDVGALIVCEPDSAEAMMDVACSAIEALNPNEGPFVMVLDSIAAAPPEKELEGAADTSSMGVKARLLNQQFRKLGILLARKRACLIVINQVRFKLGVVFGSPTTTPGGQAVKHHASIRLELVAAAHVKRGTEMIGREISIRCRKNKLAPPHREATLRLMYASGWDGDWSTLELAKDRGLVKDTCQDVAAARAALGWADAPGSTAPEQPAKKRSKKKAD